MKITATLMGLFLVFASFSQNSSKSEVTTSPEVTTKGQTSTVPSAQVTRTENGVTTSYQFVSNLTMTADRAMRYESRFPTVYPDIINITIDSNSQQVEIVLPASHSNAEVEEMINRFGYSGYQIVN